VIDDRIHKNGKTGKEMLSTGWFEKSDIVLAIGILSKKLKRSRWLGSWCEGPVLAAE
jgi:hypothetical protein